MVVALMLRARERLCGRGDRGLRKELDGKIVRNLCIRLVMREEM